MAPNVARNVEDSLGSRWDRLREEAPSWMARRSRVSRVHVGASSRSEWNRGTERGRHNRPASISSLASDSATAARATAALANELGRAVYVREAHRRGFRRQRHVVPRRQRTCCRLGEHARSLGARVDPIEADERPVRLHRREHRDRAERRFRVGEVDVGQWWRATIGDASRFSRCSIQGGEPNDEWGHRCDGPIRLTVLSKRRSQRSAGGSVVLRVRVGQSVTATDLW
jgi:hypothetical protein